MRFIKLTYENGNETIINIELVREMNRSTNLTFVFFGDNDYIKVKETINEILSKI